MVNYENRVVLFLDILGFSEIIENTVDKNEEEIASKTQFLIDLIGKMTKVANSTPKNSSKVVTQFSDSIVISFKEDDREEIQGIFFNLQRLIANLLEQKILCRGAISYGKLFHDESIVFGPALVEAYFTESQAALYPRVILDNAVLEIMRKNFSFKNSNSYANIRFDSNVKSELEKDSDDKFYVDYFSGAMYFFRDDNLFEMYENLRKVISDGLRRKKPNEKIKYTWMRNKYNYLPTKIEKINNEEIDLFDRRPDIERFYKTFKPIKGGKFVND